MVMVKCQKCGVNLPEKAQFCGKCGTRIELSGQEDIPVLCPNRTKNGNACRMPLEKNNKFCLYCGWEINPVIFQPGSHSCTKKFGNGSFCGGIISRDSKHCTKCGQTVEQVQGQTVEQVQDQPGKNISSREYEEKEGESLTKDDTQSVQGLPIEQDHQGNYQLSEQLMNIDQNKLELPTNVNPLQKQPDRYEADSVSIQGAFSTDEPVVSITSDSTRHPEQIQHQTVFGYAETKETSTINEVKQSDTRNQALIPFSEALRMSNLFSVSTNDDGNFSEKSNNSSCMEIQEGSSVKDTNDTDDTEYEDDCAKVYGTSKKFKRKSKSKIDREKKKIRKLEKGAIIFANKQSNSLLADRDETIPESSKSHQTRRVALSAEPSKSSRFNDAEKTGCKAEKNMVQVGDINPECGKLCDPSVDDNNSATTKPQTVTTEKPMQHSNVDPNSGKSVPSGENNASIMTQAATKSETDEDNASTNSHAATITGTDESKHIRVGNTNPEGEMSISTVGYSISESQTDFPIMSNDSKEEQNGNDSSELWIKQSAVDCNSGITTRSMTTAAHDQKNISQIQMTDNCNSANSTNTSLSVENKCDTASEIGSASGKVNNETDQNNSQKSGNNEQNGASKMIKSPSNGREMQRYEHNRVKVVFHAILSPSILNNKNDEVYIRFSTNTLIPLQKKRIHKKNYVEYTTIYWISRNLNYVYYRYFVSANGGYTWIPEYLFDRNNDNFDRCFQIHQIKTDVFHRYDGIIESSLYFGNVPYLGQRLKDSRIFENAEKAFTIFFKTPCNDLEIGIVSVEDFLESVECIRKGLGYVYCTCAGRWNSQDDFDKFLGKRMKHYLPEMIEQNGKSKPPSLSIALGIVYLLNSYHIEDCKNIDLLCEKMIVEPLGYEKVCEQMDSLKKQFPTKMELIKMKLQCFVNKLAGDSNVSWLYCVPLLHFLWEKCHPYKKPNLSTEHDNPKPEWWGVEEYRCQNDLFREKNKFDKKTQNVIQKLLPMFKVDYLLPRTLMTILKFEHLEEVHATEKFPADVCLAKLYYHLKIIGYGQETDHQKMQKFLWEIYQQACESSSIDSDLEDLLASHYRVFVIGFDLLKEALRYSCKSSYLTICHAAAIVLCALALFNEIFKDSKDKMNFQRNHLELFDDFRRKLFSWLEQNFYIRDLKTFRDCLKTWDFFLNLKLPNGEIRTAFSSSVEDHLQSIIKEKIHKLEKPSAVIDVYCQYEDNFGSVLQGILIKLAMEALTQGSSSQLEFQKLSGDCYEKLLSQVFEKHWTKLPDEELVTKALQWPAFEHFLKIFYQESRSETWRLECSTKLTQAVTALMEKMELLKEGSICVKDLKLISTNREIFKGLLMIITTKNKGDNDIKHFDLLLKIREMELKDFQTLLEDVKILLQLCCRIDAVDIKRTQKVVSDLVDFEDKPLNVLCHSGDWSSIENPDKYRANVIAFDLDDEVLHCLPEIMQKKDSFVFTEKWAKTGIEVAKQKEVPITITEMLEEIWYPVRTWWNELYVQIESGEILFQDFENLFRNMNEEQLSLEFKSLAGGQIPKWKDERLTQIRQYRELKECVGGARAIISVVESYELKGNFGPIELITNLTEDSEMQMREMNALRKDTYQILSGFTKEHAACLEQFISCKPLVIWLRESMPSGLKELKVFVDLASISAGEGDMEIAKVQCLHAATTGYAPLIFSLTGDIDYENFLNNCEMVWKALKTDPDLPKKLEDTSTQLEWLKTVKQAHGSVEVTSLAQAETINSVGVYTIGKIQDFAGNCPGLEDVIRLHVIEDEQCIENCKKYHYGQLHDLQSRLMLVAGKAEKGKDDVDRFTMILDSVVRLGNVYTKLLSAGCVLFCDWKAKLLCDKSRTACCIITFGEGKDTQKLKGRKEHDNDDVSDIIPHLARFMENCHSEWLKYIDEKRDKYYHLNYFTIDQMVILQKELVKIGTQDKPSNLIFPLLSAIKKDCRVEDIVEAMKEAQKEVEKMDKENEETMETSDEQEEEEGKLDENEEKDNFKRELRLAGYSEALVLRALQHFSTDNVDEAVVWCMEHEDDVEDEKIDVVGGNLLDDDANAQTVTFHGWTSNQKSISGVTADILGDLPQVNQEVFVDPLIKGLESLWKTFLTSISSSVSDYLSVEHLGLILHKLSNREKFMVNREFLQCFTVGVPNLIICPQIDLLHSVLTIYKHDTTQPLPQPDEVLICSSHTTIDQVDTFWRRAVFATSERIYCLVNGDLLDYDVSDKGDQCLENHMEKAKNRGIKYRLVVLCSTENEYKSRIVAALDKFRRPNLPVANLQLIRQYLQDKLRVDNVADNMITAAQVDFDRSTVRVVKSLRAGVGKTLYKKRMEAELYHLDSTLRTSEAVVSIPLHEREINVDEIMSRLLECTLQPGRIEPRIFHIDVSHEVYAGVDSLLFHLLILGYLSDSAGYIWRKAPHDHYIVETMPRLTEDTRSNKNGELVCLHRCLDILPDIICRSPEESLNILQDINRPSDLGCDGQLFDHEEFVRPSFQRPYQYLKRMDDHMSLNDIDPNEHEGSEVNCLQILLRHCGMRDPSWSELKHFVWFLNTQLEDFEVSAFCGSAAEEDLPGFAKFVLKFLIQMSRDFATRSLKMSEQSPEYVSQEKEKIENADENELLQMRRTWESSPHPYIFFNPDHNTMTFLGFYIDHGTGNLLDHQTRNVLEAAIMARNLKDSLIRNKVNINENFDALPRGDKIYKLCSVMGMDMPYDPDPTYELTTDNVKKILAIYMRFKCDIPVIIMGETGCGKTRLVKFMCSLQCPPGVEVENMILMKVHGGTKKSDIIKKVRRAEKIAKENSDSYGPHLQTVLFFDEANTTEAIGLIKEIMCDKTLEGKSLDLCKSLKIIAACNPYRKHTDELIKRLEKAGLGYHVDAESTVDRLGRIPMRRLVYRVQPLPQSLLPLVWDFGQLDTNVEELYIRQMVLRYINHGKLPRIFNLENIVSRILTASQDFMRAQKDECSFVSLRDVERVLEVMSWFYAQAENRSCLFRSMHQYDIQKTEYEIEEEEEDDEYPTQNLSDITRSLILALGVCYHACLKKRDEYRQTVAGYFIDPCQLPGGADRMLQEIERCQNVFLDNVQLGKNIAQNQALKENVFMMVTCIELRIPLFLVGKPGSSKSLAKTIVADAMQGHSAHKQLFKEYKAAQMVSFQCSPLSVPEGIVGTFRQCANFQKDKDLNAFVSVVVLDEVGLAEDSPRMPLKTLHPLLEDGCEGDELPEQYKKVAFIGISNWALDPAKMNRGILVQREVPEINELIQSAEGICSEDANVLLLIKPVIKDMATSYLELFKEASTNLREFFGLRDFYSLLKMVYGFADTYKEKPSWKQLEHAILRNFGGMEGIDPVKVFSQNLVTVNLCAKISERDPDCSSAGLIQACLAGDRTESESRYLLLLTENYGALNILQQKILTMHDAITIFGSSFPSDQEYTQICRNINRIKVCMETGRTVVLLNLENLYESLYDALNQYYVEFGGDRFVDLGLGSHRVKCRVHKQFRLIVVAEKQIVYAKFPIPLINRLEKHFLNISTMLTPQQLKLAQKLESWTKDFAMTQNIPLYRRGTKQSEFTVNEVFVGYHADMCPAVILHVIQEQNLDVEEELEILKESKKLLLWCATPDSVARVLENPQNSENDSIRKIYFEEQQHECLSEYLCHRLQHSKTSIFAQITTHSKLITTVDMGELSKVLRIPQRNMILLTLQSFDTEQQFCRQIRSCLEGDKSLLVVQSDCWDQNSRLVACARYCIQDELHQIDNGNVHVVFIIQLPRIAGGCFSGFQCGRWQSLHIDDLRPNEKDMLTIPDMQGQSVGDLVSNSCITYHDVMDIEEGNHMVEHRMEHTEMEVDENEISDNIISDELRSHHNLSIHNVIFSCIQSAIAMIKDTKDGKLRETARITIMLKLLQSHNCDQMMIMGLGKHLGLLLKEKEKNFNNAENWLGSIAARAENINKAGTFRCAWMQCIETSVTPILAGIIAFIDTNSNLDCLSSSQSGSWRQQLWMEIMNCPQATGMQYNTQLVSPGRRNQEVTEIMVNYTGAENHIFIGDMPFSWLIFRLIEDTVKTTYSTSGADSQEVVNVIVKTRDVIMNTSMGRILQPFLQDNVQDIAQAYLCDFVHMVYPVKTNEEHKLVCESMYIQTRSVLKEQYGDGLAMIVGFHVSYDCYAGRLKNFASLNTVWLGCSQAIMEFPSKSPNSCLLTDEEMTLDVLGLHLLLKKLEPEKETLNQEQGRQEWLKNVHLYRPVVERILDLLSPGNNPVHARCGASCYLAISESRLIWTSVVVVKLFIEHICSMESLEKDNLLKFKRVMPLWTMVKSGADMKKLESLEKIEMFLKICNRTAATQIFDISKEDNKCKQCESLLDGPPVTLHPCKHIICTKCWKEMKVMKEFACPACYEEVLEDYDPLMHMTDNKQYTRYFDYKRRCNSFFVEVVSQLCFADGTPPEEKVVEKLMKYITRETRSQKVVTKEMSIFDDDIDPTPVLRSFLLQLVLRTSDDQVYRYLEDYMTQANQFVDQCSTQNAAFVDLCLLIIQCIEDSFHHMISKSEEQEHEEVSLAGNMLRNSRDALRMNKQLDVGSLQTLAQIRFGLTVTAKYVHEMYVSKSRDHNQTLRHLIQAAYHLCQDCGTNWPCIYFIKHLCRCYGLESYEVVSNSTEPSMCRWMRMLKLQRDEKLECSDNYVVCGQQYLEFRETITKCLLGENLEYLEQKLDNIEGQGWQERTRLLLAFHRELTTSNVYPQDDRRQVMQKTIGPLTECLAKHRLFQGQRMLIQVLKENSVWKRFDILNFKQGQSLQDQSIACLLVHTLITLLQLPGEKTLIQPLKALALQPQTMMNAFLPTMPQDELTDIKEALLQGRTQFNFDENPILYRCPNGHPYVIGDCGKPYYVSTCKGCGSTIGGKRHLLQSGNIKDTGKDETQPGHILGRAEQKVRGQMVTMRNLTPVGCATLRLFTHIAMILGANENVQAICNIIKPDIEENEVYDFLLKHIMLDISILQKTTGYSIDDVILLNHNLLNTMLKTHNQDERLEQELCDLTTKESRNRWEDMFTARYITCMLQTMDTDLKINNNLIATDKRLGSDPLLCLLYETDTPKEVSPHLHDVPAVWRYRKRISMDHLTTEFQNQIKDDYKVLQLFLKEEQHLRALRLVPSIMHLQKLLIQKYQRKLDRAEANTSWSLKEVIDDFKRDGREEEVKQLIADFGKAWDCVRESLSSFPFPTVDGNASLSREYSSRQVTMETNVSMLLPSHRDVGLCSYALLYYMLQKQNSFLEKYCRAKKQKMEDLPRIKVADVTPAHLICYHPDRDILSIVLANCNYSFEVGHGTTITYDFQNIERQLMDRFLFSKSFIEIDEIDLMTYRSDATNSSVFANLRAKLKQEQLGPALRRQICEEFRSSLPDICDSLDNLDITISFLKSVGEKRDCSLENFMINTLKLRNPLFSRKSRQVCQCKHAQSLWITLALEKTKCIATYHRDAFESIKPELKVELTEEQTEALDYFCDGLQIDKLDMLIECLFECLMLRLTISQNQEDEDYVDVQKMSLRDFLIAHIENPSYDEDIIYPDWMMETLGKLSGKSEEPIYLQVKHSVAVWLCLYKAYGRKDKERHR